MAPFDAVLGKQILHHLDLGVAIPEIVRVLRPGGRAVFLEPLIHNPLLEGYRRLTPHLPQPHRAGAQHGRPGTHRRAFQPVGTSGILPLRRPPGPVRRTHAAPARPCGRASAWLGRLDRRLMAAAPVVGRYAWENRYHPGTLRYIFAWETVTPALRPGRKCRPAQARCHQ